MIRDYIITNEDLQKLGFVTNSNGSSSFRLENDERIDSWGFSMPGQTIQELAVELRKIRDLILAGKLERFRTFGPPILATTVITKREKSDRFARLME